MILRGHDAFVMMWVSDQIGRNVYGPHRKAFGVILPNGEFAAGIVYHDFSWPDIHVTMAATSPRWATKPHMRELLRYPFVDLACKRLTAVTGATNQSARSFLCRFGFILEGHHRDAFPEGDAVSYGLMASDAARWLTEEHSDNRQVVTTVCT